MIVYGIYYTDYDGADDLIELFMIQEKAEKVAAEYNAKKQSAWYDYEVRDVEVIE